MAAPAGERPHAWRRGGAGRSIARSWRRIGAVLLLSLAAAVPAGGSFAAADGRLAAGTALMRIEFGGRQLSYLAHLPKSYDGRTATPLVVVLHGTGGSGKGMLWVGRFEERSETAGYIVVAPRSLGRAFNENSGRGGRKVRGVDDVGFIEAVIDDIGQRAAIDQSRIFVAGFSSGASMAQRVALESAGGIAAVASVGGHLWAPERRPVKARSILLLWGADDPLNPFNGGKVIYPRANVMLDKPALRTSAARWAARLGCAEGPAAIPSRDGVRALAWRACRDGTTVEFYTVKGLGHHWPGGQRLPYPERIVGRYSDRIDATDLIWDFFRRQAR